MNTPIHATDEQIEALIDFAEAWPEASDSHEPVGYDPYNHTGKLITRAIWESHYRECELGQE